MASREIEILAAEYVLGLLDASAMAQAEQRLAADSGFAVAVEEWEKLLSPLAETVPQARPPSGLLARIEQVLDAASPAKDGRFHALTTRIETLQRSLAAWRMAAIAAAAAAAAIALAWFGGLNMPLQPQLSPARYVAMLQSDAGQTGFVVAFDMKEYTCDIRSMAPDLPPSKAYELWALMKDGKPPMSLGVIGTGVYSTMPMPSELDSEELNKGVKLAVSLEPPGGAPGKRPTGPVVFAGDVVKMTP